MSTTSTLPEEQNALLITAKGERMALGKRRVPKPAPGQVLVRNIAAALNPADMCVDIQPEASAYISGLI